jgi:hypothetical protein
MKHLRAESMNDSAAELEVSFFPYFLPHIGYSSEVLF